VFVIVVILIDFKLTMQNKRCHLIVLVNRSSIQEVIRHCFVTTCPLYISVDKVRLKNRVNNSIVRSVDLTFLKTLHGQLFLTRRLYEISCHGFCVRRVTCTMLKVTNEDIDKELQVEN